MTQGKKFFLILPFIVVFSTCGIEDYPFIYPIPQSNVSPSMNDYATVRVPTNNSDAPFSHFAVFYKIYVSDQLVSSTATTDTFNVINPLLASDYSSVLPYIDSDTLVNTDMDQFFRNRGFKYLQFQNADIDNVLSGVLGKTIVFDFSSSNVNPSMRIGASSPYEGEYILLRSNGFGEYDPLPADRFFISRTDLYRVDYINSNTNADVVNKSSMPNPDRYTYAAFFIAAVGIDNASFIYSTPSLIHVFKLPDQ